MTLQRTAVITGGSRGIGLATAERLLGLGHRVYITGRGRAALERAQEQLSAFGPVEVLPFDSSDPVATREALAPTQADILVANVGMAVSGSVQETSLEDWHRVLQTNLTSAFVAMKTLLPHMVGQRWGRIVTVGSMASHQPIRHGAAYTASKHGLLGLTRAAAADLQNCGVTVNMVAPAFVRTEMTMENAQRIAEATGISIEQAERKLAGVSTLGRLIEPQEVAEAICRYITDDGQLTGHSTTIGFTASAP